MDIKDIKDLIEIINNTNIETVEIEKSDIRLLITKSKNNSVTGTPIIERQVPQENPKENPDDKSYIVKSPMVGTYYASSDPDSAPFVKAGDKIEKGQIICIIEAMKIMNEIESDVSGEVVEILVNNEDVVQYGQALMKVRMNYV